MLLLSMFPFFLAENIEIPITFDAINLVQWVKEENSKGESAFETGLGHR